MSLVEGSTQGAGSGDDPTRRARPYLDPNDPSSWARALGTAPADPSPTATPSPATPATPGPPPSPDAASPPRWSPAGQPIAPPEAPPGHVGPVFEPVAPAVVRPGDPTTVRPPGTPAPGAGTIPTDHGGRLYLGPDGQLAPILPRPSKPSRSVGRLVAVWMVLLVAFIILLLVSLSWAPPTPGG